MIWCEPFAGSAALTYRLCGGRAPISYMGGKSGYAATILACLGVRGRPAGIVLGEVGPFAGVHAALGGATGLSAEDVAGFVLKAAWSYEQGNPSTGFWGPDGGRAVATVIAARVEQAPTIAALIRSWADEPPRDLWTRLKARGWPSLMPVEGGRWLGPQSVEDVAGWMTLADSAFIRGQPEGHGVNTLSLCGGDRDPVAIRLPPKISSLPTFPPLAVWQGTAETLVLPADLRGWVIYMDPPYQATTGYPFGDCPRASVLALARGYSERGATVAISEAADLSGDLGAGWCGVEIGHERRGAKRTFSKQQSEWLTLNREPQHRPARGQVGLFGGGAC